MNQEIIQEIERIKSLSDFEAREELSGFGFWLSPYTHQFYKVEDKNYKKTYMYMFKKLEVIYKEARKGIKVFNCEIEIKNKRGLIFQFEESFEERNKEEVLRRIKEKEFFNYYSRSRNKIKNPIFNKIDIKEVLK